MADDIRNPAGDADRPTTKKLEIVDGHAVKDVED